MTKEEMNAWVKSVTDRIERDSPGSRQNRFRLLAKTNLLNALGRRSNFQGFTVAEVLDASAVEVAPGFKAKYDPTIRDLAWPE